MPFLGVGKVIAAPISVDFGVLHSCRALILYKSGNPPQNVSKNPTVNVYLIAEGLYQLGFTNLEAQERSNN